MNDNQLFDPADAAQYLGLSVHTLNIWRSMGKGPSYRKLGRKVKYTKSDLDDFVSNTKVTPTDAYAA